MRIFTIAVSVAVLAVSCFSADAMAAKRTFKIYQEKPYLTHLDLGSQGNSHGDMLAFEGAVTGENGVKGMIQGILITVDIAEGDDVTEDRVGAVYYDFGGGNSLAVAAHVVYKDKSPLIEPGVPQVRAVIGGTGDYIGANGQITTIRNADGSYEYLVELIN